MSETEKKILSAAIDTFARYGFRRTTMGDVAAAAGLSRQTLYAAFASKEDLLEAAIAAVGKRALDRLEDGWRDCTKPGQILDLFCQTIVIEPFEMMRRMPDSEVLLSGLAGGCKEAFETIQNLHTEVLAARLEAAADVSALQANKVANFFVQTSKGLKYIAEDGESLREQLALLITVTEDLIAKEAA